MFMLRLVIDGYLNYLYFRDGFLDVGNKMELVSNWATLGNRIQTFVNRDDAKKVAEHLLTHRQKLMLMKWSDSEEKVVGKLSYQGYEIVAETFFIEVIAMADMKVVDNYAFKR